MVKCQNILVDERSRWRLLGIISSAPNLKKNAALMDGDYLRFDKNVLYQEFLFAVASLGMFETLLELWK